MTIATLKELQAFLKDNWSYAKQTYMPSISGTVLNSKTWNNGLSEQWYALKEKWNELQYTQRRWYDRVRYPRGKNAVSKTKQLLNDFNVPTINSGIFSESFSFENRVSFKFRTKSGELVLIYNDPKRVYHRKYGSRTVKNIYAKRIYKGQVVTSLKSHSLQYLINFDYITEPQAWALLKKMDTYYLPPLMMSKSKRMRDLVENVLKKGVWK